MPKKQSELPGVEAPSIPDIEEAAEAYVAVRDKRMAMTTKEIAAKQTLIDVCKKHVNALGVNGDGDHVYTFEDEVVILQSGKENVKVKKVREEKEED